MMRDIGKSYNRGVTEGAVERINSLFNKCRIKVRIQERFKEQLFDNKKRGKTRVHIVNFTLL